MSLKSINQSIIYPDPHPYKRRFDAETFLVQVDGAKNSIFLFGVLQALTMNQTYEKAVQPVHWPEKPGINYQIFYSLKQTSSFY